jgi:BMFP domain-containing protein YqiC
LSDFQVDLSGLEAQLASVYTTYFAEVAAQLEPLGGKARGMRLPADDWNRLVAVLVDALVKVGRVQDAVGASLRGQFAPIEHAHPGEVTALWLEPELRNQLATGGETLPTRQALAAMQQTVAQLRAENARLAERLEALERKAGPRRPSIDDAFLKRLMVVEEQSITMDAIIKTQNGFKKDVKNLVDLRSQLTDAAGAPIDLSALSRQVTDLDRLRGRMEGVDGKPLALKDLQVQVLEIANRPAGGPALDAGFASFQEELIKVRQDSETRAASLREELTRAHGEAVSALGARLDQVATESKSGIEAANELVRGAEARLAKGFTDEIGLTRTTLAATLRQQAGEVANERLADVDARVDERVGTRATELRSALTKELGASLDDRFKEHVSGTTDLFDSRFVALQTKVDSAAQSIPKELSKQIRAVETNLNTRIDNQVEVKATALSQSLNQEVDKKLAAGMDAGLLQIRTAADRTVSSRLADLDVRIAESVTSATRTLPDQIAETVEVRLQRANIPGQIEAASRQLGTDLRNEIKTSEAKVQSASNTALTNALVNLRGDMVAQPPSGRGLRPDMVVLSRGPG